MVCRCRRYGPDAPASRRGRTRPSLPPCAGPSSSICSWASISSRAANSLMRIRKCGRCFDEMRECLPGEAAHRHGIDRIRRKAVAIGRRRAEKISRQRKADHLPPPVRQQLVQTHHARGQAVDGTSDLAGGEERLVGRQMNVASDPLELREIGLVERAADAQRADGTGRAAAEIGAIGIRRDGSYHSLPLPVRAPHRPPYLPAMAGCCQDSEI